MKKNNLEFKTDSISIIIDLKKPINTLYCCEEVPIVLIHNKAKIILSNDSLKENMFSFNYLLAQAVNNKLSLHPSITQDIGLLFNEELQEKPGLFYEKIENQDYWIGNKYQLFNHLYAAWLFNDIKGNIILEITPIYPGNFLSTSNPNEMESVESYETWIQHYQPYLTLTIPESIALQWLSQVKKIIKQIEANNGEEYH